MYKKKIAVILAIVTMMGMTGCQSETTEAETTETSTTTVIEITTTTAETTTVTTEVVTVESEEAIEEETEETTRDYETFEEYFATWVPETETEASTTTVSSVAANPVWGENPMNGIPEMDLPSAAEISDEERIQLLNDLAQLQYKINMVSVNKISNFREDIITGEFLKINMYDEDNPVLSTDDYEYCAISKDIASTEEEIYTYIRNSMTENYVSDEVLRATLFENGTTSEGEERVPLYDMVNDTLCVYIENSPSGALGRDFANGYVVEYTENKAVVWVLRSHFSEWYFNCVDVYTLVRESSSEDWKVDSIGIKYSRNEYTALTFDGIPITE